MKFIVAIIATFIASVGALPPDQSVCLLPTNLF